MGVLSPAGTEELRSPDWGREGLPNIPRDHLAWRTPPHGPRPWAVLLCLLVAAMTSRDSRVSAVQKQSEDRLTHGQCGRRLPGGIEGLVPTMTPYRNALLFSRAANKDDQSRHPQGQL